MRQSKREELSARIDGEIAFNKNHHCQDATLDISSIIHEANRLLCSSAEISEKVLEITISGPTMSPLTIIDLPGYINTTMDGQDKGIVQTIRDINTRYIKDSRTIILAVVPANVDLNNMFVLGEAERYDEANERTIPIVTKPDTIEPDLLPSLIQTLLNKRKYMKLGYLVMKNSSLKELDKSWDDARMFEASFFKSSPLWKQVPDARKGRISVKNFLGNFLYEHIRKEMPHREFANMGPEIFTPENAKAKYFEWILKIKCTLEEVLDGKYSLDYIDKSAFTDQGTTTANDHPTHADGNIEEPPTLECDSRFIRASLHKLYSQYNVAMNMDYFLSTDKISDLVQRYRANELIGFNSFKTFTQIYAGTLHRWHSLTKSHVANIHLYLHHAITSLLSSIVDAQLKDTLILEFDKFYSAQTSKIDETIEDVFADESIPFTMNTSYYDNIIEIRNALEEKQMEFLLDRFKATGIKHVPKATVDAKTWRTNSSRTASRRQHYSNRLIDSPMKRKQREELNEKVAVLKKSLQEL
ncbi:hypothetical protein BGZ70_000334 [Mortierella alpina]|uniref:Dynamin GTPase domain-containing protein n=1 Tax=Mortierella alpina TaxID=64518 RepID=A0A9P6IY17_MORAP|nr:hypothetical protein BGZ70_000334 [Mortierella alpina]